MKKITLTVFVCLSFTIAFFNSCRKSDDGDSRDELPSTITTVYERSNPNETDPSFLADHVIKIEEISFDDGELDRYKVDDSWTRYIESNINFSESIKRYSFDNMSMQLITVPLNSQSEREVALIYCTSDAFMFAKCVVNSLSNGNLLLQYKPFESSILYYSVEINPENYFNLELENNMPFQNVFGNRIGRPNCYIEFPDDFWKCMECALKECNRRWGCRLAIAVTPPIVTAAVWTAGCNGL